MLLPGSKAGLCNSAANHLRAVWTLVKVVRAGRPPRSPLHDYDVAESPWM
jgi:hypothetical protein